MKGAIMAPFLFVADYQIFTFETNRRVHEIPSNRKSTFY
ncbi:hypothetical protein SAMN06265377_0778 [Flagellimonas pacifica]|uniref:Uncharacterized protein n=1 Tax=Flagellimonas pacifica TaxID=1247520 RepID=A0A285MD52_9FLAO|nr:hypothetical protein SAMN06265377_0778 [Allomuricauda parva]